MNQSNPIKGKEEIYKEAWAKWANETFITDPPLKKEDCDNEHSWILEAMEQYAKQFETPIAEGEERLFTLKEALDIWDSAQVCEYEKHFGQVPPLFPNKPQYFKEKFNIDL